MDGKRYFRVVGSLLVLVLSAGADSRADGDSPQNAGGVGLDVTVRTDSDRTGPEKLAWLDKQGEAAKGVSFRVQSMLDMARKEKDILRITCLDDKLTQIRVSLKGIEERAETVKVAVRSGDEPTANQQYAILKIYFSRIQGLEGEAENCIGGADVVLGAAETTVEIDDSVTIEDPSEDLPPDNVGIEQPPHASGYY